MATKPIQGNVRLKKGIARVELTACTYSTALSMPQFLAGPPKTDADTGIALIDTQHHNLAIIRFAGTDAADETLGYHVVGLVKVTGPENMGQGFVTERLAVGAITLGATTLSTYGAFVEASTSLVADTITETGSHPASYVYSPAGDETATLFINTTGYQYIYVQVSTNGKTAATMDVITQVADNLGGTNIANLELSGSGLASAANQTSANTLLGTIDGDTGSILTATGATSDSKAAVDGAGSVVAQLRRATFEADRAGDFLSTIDADTSNIALSVAETEACLEQAFGDRLTFERISIAQGSTPAALTIKQATGDKYARLHALIGTVHSAGTLKVHEDSDGAGSNPADLCGAMTLSTNTLCPIQFNAHPEACLVTSAINYYLRITTSGGAFNGYAIISTATS